MRKIATTIAAFIAGVCTIPLAVIAWPFFLATIVWYEFEKED